MLVSRLSNKIVRSNDTVPLEMNSIQTDGFDVEEGGGELFYIVISYWLHVNHKSNLLSSYLKCI